MIRNLRKLDRLYFGSRVGNGSAIHMAICLLTGVTPWVFARNYWHY